MHFVQRMTLALIGHQSPMCEAIKGSSLKHENGVDFSAVNILLLSLQHVLRVQEVPGSPVSALFVTFIMSGESLFFFFF
jgi:hypothetical protein